MRTFAGSLVLTFLLLSSAAGQGDESTKPSVIWSPEAGCHTSNGGSIKAALPQCSRAEVNGMTFYVLSYKGITYALTHRPTDRHIITSVQISNKSGAQIQFSPQKSRLVYYEAGSGFFSGTKPTDTDSALSHGDLRQLLYHDAPATETEGGIRPGLQVQGSVDAAPIRPGPGSGRGMIRVEPRPNSSDTPRGGSFGSALVISKAVFDYVLLSRSLPDQEKAAGHIVFKNSKTKGFAVFVMNAGDANFIFPVGAVVPAEQVVAKGP